MRWRRPLLAALLAAALLPAAAAGAELRFTPGEARDALSAAEQALDPSASVREAAEVTPALRDLAVALPALGEAGERRAESILARPTDKGDDEYFGKEADDSPICSERFCVHFSAKRKAAPSDAFLARIIEALDATYAVENVELGWRAPKSDGGRGARRGVGGDGQTDVYVDNLGKKLYGYAAPDAGQKGARRHAYLVLDKDYRGFPSPPVESMQATVAHEYNHILQFGYDTLQDLWLFESTAVWMEQQVYPKIDDYLNFVPSFATQPDAPLTGGAKIYGDGVFQHWLDSRYGPRVVRREWELSLRAKPKHDGAAAVDRAVDASGGRSFSREFAGFAAATAEWRALDAFPDAGRYPDVRRRGDLGAKASRVALEKTAYELTEVRNPTGAVRLRVEAPRGFPSAIALIGRDGTPRGGRVVVRSRYLGNGGAATTRLANAGRYERVTAAVINADGSRGKVSGRRVPVYEAKLKR